MHFLGSGSKSINKRGINVYNFFYLFGHRIKFLFPKEGLIIVVGFQSKGAFYIWGGGGGRSIWGVFGERGWYLGGTFNHFLAILAISSGFGLCNNYYLIFDFSCFSPFWLPLCANAASSRDIRWPQIQIRSGCLIKHPRGGPLASLFDGHWKKAVQGPLSRGGPGPPPLTGKPSVLCAEVEMRFECVFLCRICSKKTPQNGQKWAFYRSFREKNTSELRFGHKKKTSI